MPKSQDDPISDFPKRKSHAAPQAVFCRHSLPPPVGSSGTCLPRHTAVPSALLTVFSSALASAPVSRRSQTVMALMLSSLSAQAYMAAPMAMPTVQRANVNMAFIDTL